MSHHTLTKDVVGWCKSLPLRIIHTYEELERTFKVTFSHIVCKLKPWFWQLTKHLPRWKRNTMGILGLLHGSRAKCSGPKELYSRNDPMQQLPTLQEHRINGSHPREYPCTGYDKGTRRNMGRGQVCQKGQQFVRRNKVVDIKPNTQSFSNNFFFQLIFDSSSLVVQSRNSKFKCVEIIVHEIQWDSILSDVEFHSDRYFQTQDSCNVVIL